MNKEQPLTKLPLACLSLLFLYATGAYSLPDDENQEIVIEASRNEIFLDQGIVIYYGESGMPAEMTQGSLIITGMEIEIERRDGQLHTITAKGNPATFQQQPQVNQAIVYANASTLSLDNTAGMLNLDGNAELTQGGTVVSGQHIEYDRSAERIISDSRDSQGRIRMVIPPQTPSE